MSQAIEQQSELFSLADVAGYSDLSRKDRLFAQALFEGCTQRDAARRAGVEGSDEVVDVAASRMIRSPRVQSLMNQAWSRSGASIDATLRQAAELQKIAYQEQLASQNRAEREAAFKRWKDASMLIASIHGRLKVQVTGEINHNIQGTMVVLPASALQGMAQMRREVVAERMSASLTQGGN